MEIYCQTEVIMTGKRLNTYAALLLSAVLFITVIVYQDTAKAEPISAETEAEEVITTEAPMAGFTLYVEGNEDSVSENQMPETTEAKDSVSENNIPETTEAASTQEETQEAPTSAYDGKVVAQVEAALNIRESADEEAKKVGRLYDGCVGDIIGSSEGWYQIQSGDVTGWVSSEYVLTGTEAESYMEQQPMKTVTVNVDTLNVRTKANTDSEVIAVVELGQDFIVSEMGDEWIQVVYTPDLTGYVAAEYVTVTEGAGTAISAEELAVLNQLAEEKEQERKEAAKKKSVETSTRAAASASVDETTLLAALCQYEAGGSYDGMLAVANVVLNRVNSGRYPNTISGVIYAKGQFGGVSGGALDKYISKGPSSTAMRAAQDALSGVNNIGDYTSFCSARIANTESYSSYTIVGGNCFYKR